MPKKHRRKPSHLPKALVIGGVILLAFAILMVKGKSQPISTTSSLNTLPEAALERALEAGQPTLAFYHSTDCYQCIVMMDTVTQVYPEYDDTITLIDVNVYEERNVPLLKLVRLQYIPTLMFYNQNGEMQVHIGVMEADQLRQTLAALIGGG
jgi:thiol-disulfide isomerase/thioredoxin